MVKETEKLTENGEFGPHALPVMEAKFQSIQGLFILFPLRFHVI